MDDNYLSFGGTTAIPKKAVPSGLLVHLYPPFTGSQHNHCFSKEQSLRRFTKLLYFCPEKFVAGSSNGIYRANIFFTDTTSFLYARRSAPEVLHWTLSPESPLPFSC